MTHTCYVCKATVEPDAKGRVRVEGVTLTGTKQWVWPPVVVHEDCRLDLRTPYDDRLHEGYVMTCERIKA